MVFRLVSEKICGKKEKNRKLDLSNVRLFISWDESKSLHSATVVHGGRVCNTLLTSGYLLICLQFLPISNTQILVVRLSYY